MGFFSRDTANRPPAAPLTAGGGGAAPPAYRPAGYPPGYRADTSPPTGRAGQVAYAPPASPPREPARPPAMPPIPAAAQPIRAPAAPRRLLEPVVAPAAYEPASPPPPSPPPPSLLPPAPEAPAATALVPARPRRSAWRWVWRGLAAVIMLLVVAIVYLAITAPLSKSLQPIAPPSITLTAADNTPIARRGAIIDAPVDAATLPANVTNAFLAIEDRRFRSHWGVDPRGILRALFHNVTSGGGAQGGSTITQQLAKNAFLDSDRTLTRKLREVMIAFWLEAWLSKDEILSRYLSNVYFGDNVYGLRAAARHYFNRRPEDLSIAQAAMLAGLVKAPSRLNPTVNLAGAQARSRLVVAAMADAGFITPAAAAATRPATLDPVNLAPLPTGTYFADWVLPQARDTAGEIASQTTVRTTLDRRLQRFAERAVRGAGLRQAQVALVAMHPDGQVVAMVGGRNYAQSPFNRATQARRQPGSTFKLFVYLAAMRAGMTPDTLVDDSPVTIGGWTPHNSDGRYLGRITLRQAFARSSNVAAARLTQQVGVAAVIRAARDLGISTPIASEATIALGTSTVSLLELTQAYAAIAAGQYPVRSHGTDGSAAQTDAPAWVERLSGGGTQPIDPHLRAEMLDLLAANAQSGTGHVAALPIPTYGKTGTTQDSRDALFVGFAGDLVVGVWIGNDDNSPNAGLSGGGIPARLWHGFMMDALHLQPATQPPVVPASDDKPGIDINLGPLGDYHIGDDGPTPPEPGPSDGGEDRAPPPKEPDR